MAPTAGDIYLELCVWRPTNSKVPLKYVVLHPQSMYILLARQESSSDVNQGLSCKYLQGFSHNLATCLALYFPHLLQHNVCPDGGGHGLTQLGDQVELTCIMRFTAGFRRLYFVLSMSSPML